MKTGLKKIYAIVADTIDDTMFARQSARPGIAIIIFERFRFANAFERFSQYGFYKGENSEGYFAIGLNPMV